LNIMNESNKQINTPLVIGLDASTTATKAIAWNNRGEIIASAREAIPLSSPLPHYYEQDPEDWWTSARKALLHITRQVNPQRIKAIAISNQRETFVPIAHNGSCLRPAIVWLDERCKDEVEQFAGKIGKKKIHRITGKPVDYAPVVYRLAWMQRNEPHLFKKIHTVCDVHTYLVWKLTGSFKTSWASADPLGLFDIKSRQWSSPILKCLALRIDQVPRAYCPGTVLATLSKDAAKLTGLLPDTSVIAGGGDGQAAGSGVNALSPERAYLNLGTAVVAGVYGTRCRISNAFRTILSCSDKGFYYESSLRAGTFAIDWLIKNILNVEPAARTDIYRELEKDSTRIPAGSDNLFHLPYLCGVMNPYWDINARGAFIGLSSSHTRAHMYRAMLEGICFEILLALSTVEKAIGTEIRDLVVIGGGASSGMWCRIIADITGKNICLPRFTEASSLGAGIAASVGAGMHRSFIQAANEMTGIKQIIRPDRKQYRKYQTLFGVYKKIYPAIKKCSVIG
jgi:sugar (pentulose or hexulose) kinase